MKILEKGISSKPHCTEFMANFSVSGHISASKSTIYSIGETSGWLIIGSAIGSGRCFAPSAKHRIRSFLASLFTDVYQCWNWHFYYPICLSWKRKGCFESVKTFISALKVSYKVQCVIVRSINFKIQPYYRCGYAAQTTYHGKQLSVLNTTQLSCARVFAKCVQRRMSNWATWSALHICWRQKHRIGYRPMSKKPIGHRIGTQKWYRSAPRWESMKCQGFVPMRSLIFMSALMYLPPDVHIPLQ